MHIECHYTSCRVRFKAKKNQKYHSRECACKARREKDRLRKRAYRLREHERKIATQLESAVTVDVETIKFSSVRSLEKKRKYFYRCDTCGCGVLRPARMLHVYCSRKCRLIHRDKQRRLQRQHAKNSDPKAKAHVCDG